MLNHLKPARMRTKTIRFLISICYILSFGIFFNSQSECQSNIFTVLYPPNTIKSTTLSTLPTLAKVNISNFIGYASISYKINPRDPNNPNDNDSCTIVSNITNVLTKPSLIGKTFAANAIIPTILPADGNPALRQDATDFWNNFPKMNPEQTRNMIINVGCSTAKHCRSSCHRTKFKVTQPFVVGQTGGKLQNLADMVEGTYNAAHYNDNKQFSEEFFLPPLPGQAGFNGSRFQIHNGDMWNCMNGMNKNIGPDKLTGKITLDPFGIPKQVQAGHKATLGSQYPKGIGRGRYRYKHPKTGKGIKIGRNKGKFLRKDNKGNQILLVQSEEVIYNPIQWRSDFFTMGEQILVWIDFRNGTQEVLTLEQYDRRCAEEWDGDLEQEPRKPQPLGTIYQGDGYDDPPVDDPIDPQPPKEQPDLENLNYGEDLIGDNYVVDNGGNLDDLP